LWRCNGNCSGPDITHLQIDRYHSSEGMCGRNFILAGADGKRSQD
jgi:hypothetical protein